MRAVGCKYCQCYTFEESKAVTMREILIEQTNRRIKEDNFIDAKEMAHLDDRRIVEICLAQIKFNSVDS
jgi:hypothetical protein